MCSVLTIFLTKEHYQAELHVDSACTEMFN